MKPLFINPMTGLPAPPRVPAELTFPPESLGQILREAEAPFKVGDPSCPVCQAALHWRSHGSVNLYKAVCARSAAATRMEPPRFPGGRYCQWRGWLVLNTATNVFLVIGHGDTAPEPDLVQAFTGWHPPPSLP